MEIDAALLAEVLTDALRAGEYADAFYEHKTLRSYRFQDGKVQEAGLGITVGVGIRVLSGEQAGYAHSDDLSPAALRDAARAAALIARSTNVVARSVQLGTAPQSASTRLYADLGAPAAASTFVKILERADVAARAYDPRIVAVNALVSDEVQEVVIATSEGRFVRDVRPLSSLGVQTVAQGTSRGSGYAADGGRQGIAATIGQRSPESIASEAARIACVNSDAVDAPAGEMTVVVGAGGGGVLLHEAVGHGLEGDFNRQGTSLYAGRIGERVAGELVTIYDDGDIPIERGSIAIDDEGTPAQHKVLVENGILRGYMNDRLNATLMGMTSTGSGRRQSFRSLPQPRMCNTFMPAGTSDPDEIVRSVRRGLYAKSFAGGQVDISKGDFVFMVAEGYLIEDGAIGAPVRLATLVGNGPDIMTRVVAVGHDARFAPRHYTCGKGGQYVPVGVGMPTVKIDGVTIGGSSVG